MNKKAYINDKGYGMYEEEFKRDCKIIDIKVKEMFDDLVRKGYRPSEICFEIINAVNCRHSIYSIEKGLAERKKERENNGY